MRESCIVKAQGSATHSVPRGNYAGGGSLAGPGRNPLTYPTRHEFHCRQIFPDRPFTNPCYHRCGEKNAGGRPGHCQFRCRGTAPPSTPLPEFTSSTHPLLSFPNTPPRSTRPTETTVSSAAYGRTSSSTTLSPSGSSAIRSERELHLMPYRLPSFSSRVAVGSLAV